MAVAWLKSVNHGHGFIQAVCVNHDFQVGKGSDCIDQGLVGSDQLVFDAMVKPTCREQQQRLIRPSIKRAAASTLPSTANDQLLLFAVASLLISLEH